jgi:hypothetical protein
MACVPRRCEGCAQQRQQQRLIDHSRNVAQLLLAAASLRLMQAFGLRFKESLMLRPHQDVLTAQQAGRPADGPARYLDTHRGTKGGRCVFRMSVTARFGIVTAEFGSVTDHFGDVTGGRLVAA